MAQLNCPSCHHHGLIWDWNQSHLTSGFGPPWNGLPSGTWHGSTMLPPYRRDSSTEEAFHRQRSKPPSRRRSRRDLSSEDEADFHHRRNVSPVTSRRGPLSDDSDEEIISHRGSRRNRHRASPNRNVSPAMSRRSSTRRGSTVDDLIARRAKRNDDDTMSLRSARHRFNDDTISSRDGRRRDDETMSNRGGRRHDDDTMSNRGGRRPDDETMSNRGGRRRDDETVSIRGGRRHDDETMSNRGSKRYNDDVAGNLTARRYDEETVSVRSNRHHSNEETMSTRQSKKLDEDVLSNRADRRRNNLSEDMGDRRMSDASRRRRGSPVSASNMSPALARKTRREDSSIDSGDEMSESIKSSPRFDMLSKNRNEIDSDISEIDKNKGEDEMIVSDEVEKSLGPIPTKEWECEHCTFVNQAGTRVCIVCCKTTNQPRYKEEIEQLNEYENNKVQNYKQPVSKKSTKQSDYADSELADRAKKQLTISSPPTEKKKGRRRRTITFWLGTKLYS